MKVGLSLVRVTEFSSERIIIMQIPSLKPCEVEFCSQTFVSLWGIDEASLRCSRCVRLLILSYELWSLQDF